MSEAARTLFVISDLHVGGATGTPENPRGFRMCTRPQALCDFLDYIPTQTAPGTACELVINGDFIDFLSEEFPKNTFYPFLPEEKALLAFHNIVAREKAFFDALEKFASQHRLTILLGNHDVELAHPKVTAALVARLGGPSERLRVQLDGKPYLVGEALIEHGNLYDGFNAILPSEIETLRQSGRFEPPPGSKLVAEIMNPIKREYPFIDLLKPEQETAIPILIALRPSTVGAVARIAKLSYDASKREKAARYRLIQANAAKAQPEPFAADLGEPEKSPEEALRAVLADALDGEENAREFLDLLPEAPRPVLVEKNGPPLPFSRPELPDPALLRGDLNPLEKLRVNLLWRALQGSKKDLSFVVSHEHDTRYREAAAVQHKGIRWVIMGHTHLAKAHDNISPGRSYLNTGTWADLLPFPEFVTELREEEGKKKLHEFLEDLANNRLERWLSFRPHFARVEFDGTSATKAELLLFSAAAHEPAWIKEKKNPG